MQIADLDQGLAGQGGGQVDDGQVALDHLDPVRFDAPGIGPSPAHRQT
jgi:hypothetical protein